MLILKKKALNIRLLLLEHLNRTALLKDETVLLLRLLLVTMLSVLSSIIFLAEAGFATDNAAILRKDQSHSTSWKRWHITSLMTGNLQ
ncbi:hypothetical protein Tco_0833812 [Tanacetum coccineum]